jgi:hypothetical protein
MAGHVLAEATLSRHLHAQPASAGLGILSTVLPAAVEEPTRLFVLRHGQTAWNAQLRIQGHLDMPLNAVGRWQATRLAAACKAKNWRPSTARISRGRAKLPSRWPRCCNCRW